MSPFLRRVSPIAAIVAAIVAASFTAVPAEAHETTVPHLVHEFEGWVALAVVLLSSAGAVLLLWRSLRGRSGTRRR